MNNLYFGPEERATELLKTRGISGTAEPIILNSGGVLGYSGKVFNRSINGTDVEYIKTFFETSPSAKDIMRECRTWDGMWSIIYLSPDGRMFCFTDPLGKKQLYLKNNEAETSPEWRYPEVCSEIFPLVHDFKDFDLQYKSSVFKWGYNTDNRTPWRNVFRIMPDRMFIFSPGLKIPFILEMGGKDFLTEHVENINLEYALHEAVERRLQYEKGKIGLMLSGGLDSSIIAAIACQYKKDIEFLTINNEDDLFYAKLMAEHLGVKLNISEYNPENLTDAQIAEYLKCNETPVDLGSMIPNQDMFAIIKPEVILSGDGSDELFGGYRRMDDYDSQYSDVFEELSFYHLPRLDKACRRYKKELLNPFLSTDVIRSAFNIPYKERIHKEVLKTVFKSYLPKEILERPKLPLKNAQLKSNPLAWRKRLFDIFYNKINF